MVYNMGMTTENVGNVVRESSFISSPTNVIKENSTLHVDKCKVMVTQSNVS